MIPGIVAAGLAVTGVFEPPVSDATFADVVFLCSWNGADNATVATDDSLSAHAITFHGNAKLNTSVKQFGTASLELDGVGDYASVANHSDFHFGNGPFCIEGFVRPDTSVFQDSTIVGMWTDDSLNPQRGWRVSYTNEGLQFQFSTTGTNSSILLSAPSTIDLNTQHHFCVQRNDNALMQMFVDGVEVDSATSAANLWPSTLDLTIGANFDTVVAADLSGHIDEVRITRNWWYDGDFTVPVAEYDRSSSAGALTGIEGADAAAFTGTALSNMLSGIEGADLGAFTGDIIVQGLLAATDGADLAAIVNVDPFFANVLLLSGFEGVDAGTTFDDESSVNRTFSAVGNAQIDTAQFKFGASSLLCDGTGDCATVPDSTDWNFAGTFTIEFWFRPAADSATTRVLLAHRSNTGGTNSWQCSMVSNGASDNINFMWSTNGTADLWNLTHSGAILTSGTWHHYCVDRDASDVVRIYLDGVMGNSQSQSGAPFNTASVLSVGGQAAGTLSHNGHIDEVRISNVCRYGSDGGFTVPTSSYPRS